MRGIIINSINSPQKQQRDSFLWPIIALPSVVLLAFNIHFSFYPDQDFSMFWIGLVLTIIWFFIMLICSFFFQWNGLSKRTISCALSLVCLWPSSVILRWIPVGDYIHLATDYSAYQTKIAASPNVRLKFKWGLSGFVGTGGSERILVYDPTDTLPQENKIKDAEWRKKSRYLSGKNEYFGLWLVTRHLFEHFYLVEEWHE